MANKETQDIFERLEDFMFSRKFIFIVVVTSIAPLIWNVHQLYFNISPLQGNVVAKHAYALFYAFSFAFTVLVFTFNFIKYKPALYAVFVFIVDLLFFNPFDFVPESYLTGFTKIFLSLVLAYTGYSYAELYVKRASENRKQEADPVVYGNVYSNHGLPIETDFTCTECGRGFGSVKALNGHMAAHRNSSKKADQTSTKPEPTIVKPI